MFGKHYHKHDNNISPYFIKFFKDYEAHCHLKQDGWIEYFPENLILDRKHNLSLMKMTRAFRRKKLEFLCAAYMTQRQKKLLMEFGSTLLIEVVHDNVLVVSCVTIDATTRERVLLPVAFMVSNNMVVDVMEHLLRQLIIETDSDILTRTKYVMVNTKDIGLAWVNAISSRAKIVRTFYFASEVIAEYMPRATTLQKFRDHEDTFKKCILTFPAHSKYAYEEVESEFKLLYSVNFPLEFYTSIKEHIRLWYLEYEGYWLKLRALYYSGFEDATVIRNLYSDGPAQFINSVTLLFDCQLHERLKLRLIRGYELDYNLNRRQSTVFVV